MPVFTESNITLNFPDSNYFRFSDCAGYASLSGNYFKEMDVCWFESGKNFFWLIELKDFTSASLSKETIEGMSLDIVKKAIDSLCMFLSSKHNYPWASKLDPCFPSKPNDATQFKFITVVHCNEGKKQDIQLIHNKFRNRFKPYADLFGIEFYAVIEHSAAKRIFPNNVIQ